MNRVSKINIVFVSNNGNHIERIEMSVIGLIGTIKARNMFKNGGMLYYFYSTFYFFRLYFS